MLICDKHMGFGKCLLCVSGPMSEVWAQSTKYEIQQKCVVRMRRCGLHLPCEKHFSVRDPSFQVNAQWPTPS